MMENLKEMINRNVNPFIQLVSTHSELTGQSIRFSAIVTEKRMNF